MAFAGMFLAAIFIIIAVIVYAIALVELIVGIIIPLFLIIVCIAIPIYHGMTSLSVTGDTSAPGRRARFPCILRSCLSLSDTSY